MHVPAFAEEMNKSRRMVSLQSRALAERGWSVLQLDLFGCGDSEGDFGDATWDRWVADVSDACAWLGERAGQRPLLWGMRAGCLLATSAAARMDVAPDLLLWQPVLSGAQHLQQFLRLKAMGHLFGTGDGERAGTQVMRKALQQGQSVEVAGYTIMPGLAAGMEAATLAEPARHARVAWLEVAGSSPPAISPASGVRIDAWRASGITVESHAVAGVPFWQTQEIAECPELIAATSATLERWRA